MKSTAPMALTLAQRRWLALLAIARDKGLTASEIAAPRPVMAGLAALGLVRGVSDGGWEVTDQGEVLLRSVEPGQA